MFRFIYNLFMPAVFIFFLPQLILKYRSRGGWKSTYGERFARFGNRRKSLAAHNGAIWIHAVSVGETVVALSLIKAYLAKHPERKFIISTTTTTGQDVARTQCPPNTEVIFCPLDFPWMVKSVLKLLKPALLVIFETEIWPNLVTLAGKQHVPVVLVNGRLSDRSAEHYRRMRFFFDPLLRKFDLILAQSDNDAERFRSVSPHAIVENGGNMKFDQVIPELPETNELGSYIGSDPEQTVILAASTHPDEEELIVKCYLALCKKYSKLKLVLVPRHAERGNDLAAMLREKGCNFIQKSRSATSDGSADILLADTTGEMLLLMKNADIVIMGKSFNGHDEGHNLIEPALLAKPIVTGPVLRNFRYIFGVLKNADALLTATDAELESVLDKLIASPELREELGKRASGIIGRNRGATAKAVDALESFISKN